MNNTALFEICVFFNHQYLSEFDERDCLPAFPPPKAYKASSLTSIGVP